MKDVSILRVKKTLGADYDILADLVNVFCLLHFVVYYFATHKP